MCALFWQVKSGKSQGSSQVPENPPVDSPLFWFWNPAFTALFSLRGQDTLPNLSLLLAPTRITGSPLKSLSPRLPDSPLSQPSQLCSGHSLWPCWHHGGHRSRWSCWTVSLCPADRPVALQVDLPWSITSYLLMLRSRDVGYLHWLGHWLGYWSVWKQEEELRPGPDLFNKTRCRWVIFLPTLLLILPCLTFMSFFSFHYTYMSQFLLYIC